MCSVTAVVMGVLSAGLGIMQQNAAVAAQNEQIAWQNAVQEQNYNFQRISAESARIHEEQQKVLQDDLINQNTFLANEAYSSDIAQLNLRLIEEEMAASDQKRRASLEMLEAQGDIAASGRVGNSVQQLIADKKRKFASFDFVTSNNFAFTGLQISERKREAGIQKGSRIASKTPYLKRTILDPVKPIPRAFAKGPGFAGILSAGLSGVQFGMGVHSGLTKAGFTTKPVGDGVTKHWLPGLNRTTN